MRRFPQSAPALIPHSCSSLSQLHGCCCCCHSLPSSAQALELPTHPGAALPCRTQLLWPRTHTLEAGTLREKELPVEILERNNHEQRKGEAEKKGGKKAVSSFSKHFLLAWDNYWGTDNISCHPGHTWRTGERKNASWLWPNQLLFVPFRNTHVFTPKPLQLHCNLYFSRSKPFFPQTPKAPRKSCVTSIWIPEAWGWGGRASPIPANNPIPPCSGLKEICKF